MPPITITTNATMMILSPMPGDTDRMGAAAIPGQCGESRAKPKHQAENGRHIDPECTHHLAVDGAGANNHAQPGLGHDQIERDCSPNPIPAMISR